MNKKWNSNSDHFQQLLYSKVIYLVNFIFRLCTANILCRKLCCFRFQPAKAYCCNDCILSWYLNFSHLEVLPCSPILKEHIIIITKLRRITEVGGSQSKSSLALYLSLPSETMAYIKRYEYWSMNLHFLSTY